MNLPVQTEDELIEIAREYSERGRILKVQQLATRDKRPFWLLTIRMTRFLEVEKDFSVELEETKGVWTFVSWREIINAEPDRIIYFDLAGRVWRDCEEIAGAAINWTTKLKPLEPEPAGVPAMPTRAVERYAPSRAEKARYALQKGALPLERGLQKFTFDKATGLSVYSGKFDHRLDFRNACGHPTAFKIGDHQVASHIEFLILNVFSKFPLESETPKRKDGVITMLEAMGFVTSKK